MYLLYNSRLTSSKAEAARYKSGIRHAVVPILYHKFKSFGSNLEAYKLKYSKKFTVFY